MASSDPQILFEVLPYIRIHKDGHVERLLGTETLPSGTDPLTGVSSKDITIIPGTEVYARLYLPTAVNNQTDYQKLPVLVYFHGGGFFLSTPATAHYHNYLNKLVSESRVIAVSVNYRRAPEDPLPAAYEDSWAALKWVFSHRAGNGPEPWLNDYADFGRLFVAGVSAGGNIAHNVAMEAGKVESGLGGEILGVALVHPYFWGSVPIGSEGLYPDKKAVNDRCWPFVCPSNPDNDDPRVNPVAEGAPSLAGMGCRRVLVSVAGKDLMRDRGWLYYTELGRSGWTGVVEIHETEGEDHAFHLQNLNYEKTEDLIRRLAAFFNKK